MCKWLTKVTVAAVVVYALRTTAWADTFISGAGGVFVPYEGDAGPTGLVQVLEGQPGSRFRFGGELQYRTYKSSIFDVKDVAFDTGSIRALVQYHFLPEGISPYIGAGLGLNFNLIDSDKVERERPDLSSVQEFGFGIGLLGLAGVEFPLSPTVALFAEGRAGVDFQVTNTSDASSDSSDIGVENLGGLTALGGIRFRF